MFEIKSLRTVPRRIVNQLALLRRDPERVGRNLLQFTDPALFETRLTDIMDPVPLHVTIGPPRPTPVLHVLCSTLARDGMTGGPNTVVNLAFRIARTGVAVRLVTTVRTSTIDPLWFRSHGAELLGDGECPDVPIVTAAETAAPLEIAANDLFLATHWTTAQQLKAVLPRMHFRRFFYLLQDYEPAFYPWSSNFALAHETLGFDFWPVINQDSLAQYFFAECTGSFADPEVCSRSTVFEPAVDDTMFHIPEPSEAGDGRTVLFYARPTNARNLFGLALTALRRVVADSDVSDGWRFLSIGGRGSLPALSLGGGRSLVPAPWMDYRGYARLLRSADILLCPMLSPHTSYPVLEMAACGGLSLTNSFKTKTGQKLAAMSDNIRAAEPTIEGFAAVLRQAMDAVEGGRTRSASLHLPRRWSESLDPVALRIAGIIAAAAS